MPRGCDSFADARSLRIADAYAVEDPQRTARVERRVRYPLKIPGNPQVVPLYFHMRSRRYSCQPKGEAGKAAEGRSRKVEAGSGGRKKLCGQDLVCSGGTERCRSKAERVRPALTPGSTKASARRLPGVKSRLGPATRRVRR